VLRIGASRPNAAALVRESHHGTRPAPQFFEPVVGPLIRRKDVHDHISEVQEHPAVVAAPLAVAQLHVVLVIVLFQVLLKRTKLERRLRSGDDEEVGERGRLRNVDQGDIQCLMLGKDIDGPLGE
jgi:hypothetical protein